MASTSASIVSADSVRPVRGSHSCRLTPRSRIGAPLTVRTPSTTATRRNPIVTGIRSSPVTISPAYSRGRSSDHGSTPSITCGPAGSASARPSSGTLSRAGEVVCTASVPRPRTGSKSAWTKKSSSPRATIRTARKIPDSHHMSWSSR